jgi:hypothetical protein
MEDSSSRFRCIGKGLCGSVWAVDRPGNSRALKREDGGTGRDIQNDYDVHRRVLASLQSLRDKHEALTGLAKIHIPECHALISPNDYDWWTKRLYRFPKGYTPCKTLISERIQPLSRPVRETLIHKFCPVQLQDTIKADRDNEDCIARVYLGRRRFRPESATRRKQFFSLRNYPLHLDQMEEMGGVDTLAYAGIMAETLAMMHWGAQTDANDVEFVLASPPVSTSTPPAEALDSTTFSSETLGEHAMWVLDFDCANIISMDEAGVDQAVAAFWRNDPYYPRPGGSNEHEKLLWKTFRTRFLEASLAVLRWDNPDCLHLPGLLMDKIEEEADLRRDRKRNM